MKKIALIDMDGTVADYEGGLKNALEPLCSPSESVPEDIWNLEQYWKDRINLVKNQPGFWRNLKPIEDAIALVEVMRQIGFKIMVLTKGPYHTTSAWTEKVEWCREYLPNADITITENKSLVYGRVLFDDYPPYITGWLKYRPRGLVLMPDCNWNKYFNHSNVMRITSKTNKNIILSKLLEALERDS